MKKTIYLTFMLMPFFAISQVKEHRVNGNKIHQVADGRFELAALQLGVVGNNYFGEIKIGDCAALRHIVLDTWKPVDGYKRTATSKMLYSVYTKNEGEGVANMWDKDINLEMRGVVNNKIGTKTLEPDEQVYCEINLMPVAKNLLLKYSDSAPKYQIDNAAAFGPFIYDKNHDNGLEIHPAEQIWWRENRKDETIYHLYSFMDASEWFDDSDGVHADFDRTNCEHHPWIKNPMPFIYAIPFETKLKKSVIEYSIEKIASNCAVVNGRIEKQHKLFFGSQLIATVQEPSGEDMLEISFDNVGLNPYKVFEGDSILQGFLIIKSTINKNPCPGDGGDVLLKMTKKNRANTEPANVRPPAKEEYKVKVTLENITCISEDDGNENNEEIYGYIGVKVVSPDDPFTNILPNGKNSPLLWSKLDENHLVLTEGIPKQINSSSVYSLKKSDKIILLADLDENDAQWDNNNTTRDINGGTTKGKYNEFMGDINPFSDREVEDNRLEAENVLNKADGGKMELGVVFKPISVKDLILNQPVTRKMYFGEGGTKIEVSFKIELIQKTDAGGPIRTVDRTQ